MLLRFSVENFLSFRDEASLSMIASSDERHTNHVFQPRGPKSHRVLRGAAIYGANGHGKTNLVHALMFVRKLIIEGSDLDRQLKVRKFRSDINKDDHPATFVFNFMTQDVEYEYGLRLHRTHVAEEWLFASPHGREVRLFERVTKPAETHGAWETAIESGSSLTRRAKGEPTIRKDFLEFVGLGTRPTQPFLTEAIQRNVEVLRPVYDWFRNDLQVISAEGEYVALGARAHSDTSFIERLSSAIRGAGVGIDHLETEVRTVEIDDFRDLPPEILHDLSETLEPERIALIGTGDSNRTMIQKNSSGELEVIDLVFVHKRDDGTEARFTQEEESSGTRRLLNLLPMLFDLATSDRTFIIDELDRKLHPLLAYDLLRNFLSNSPCGQLIFTTHNTHLLDLDLIRRDEIWFVEKSAGGYSELYSLADLKVRPDVEIRKGYLNGRFGAVPFLGNQRDLGWLDKPDGKANYSEETAA